MFIQGHQENKSYGAGNLNLFIRFCVFNFFFFFFFVHKYVATVGIDHLSRFLFKSYF